LLLRAKLQSIVRRLALARLSVHAGRKRAALDGALRRVAPLSLEVELRALAAAEAADRAAVVGHWSDSPPLWWAAAVVGDWRHIGDRAHLEPGRLQGADRRLASGARSADEHLDRAHAVLERLLGGRLGGLLSGKGGRFAAALEALRPGRAPRDDAAVRGRKPVDHLAKPRHLILVKVPRPLRRVDVGHLQDLLGGGVADPMDVGQRNANALLRGYVNAGDSRHLVS